MNHVIIAGAGASGMCAAIAAARSGAEVTLIERTGLLGGSNTLSLVCPLMGFHAGGDQVVAGLAQEIVDRLGRRGGTLGHIPDPLGVAASITPIEPEILKQVYFELLRETPNLSLMLHTTLLSAQREQDRITGITVQTESGRRFLSADVFIDATGDADLAASAGIPFTFGRVSDGLAQPMTMVLRIGNVDLLRVRAFMKAHPDQFVLASNWEEIPYTAVSGFFDLVREARDKGILTFPRDRVLFFEGVHPGEVMVNMSRVIQCRSTEAEERTRAELEGRRQADEILRFLREQIVGFEQARLVETGMEIGIRESRHVHGRYTLSEADILRAAVFEDSVAMCGFPIDIHDPQGKELYWDETQQSRGYDIPFRVMLPEGLRNLLVTGRAISATHGAAASARITPTAMALGEAAGIATALAENGNLETLDMKNLQQQLLRARGIPGRRFLGSVG